MHDFPIKIIDNFLDPIDLKKVIGETSCQEWKIQQTDIRKSNHLPFLIREVSHDEFFNSYLFNKVKDELDGDYKLERVYFNGQWYGREGSFHQDGCDLTALLYVQHYEYGWGGFTEIMTSPNSPTVIHPLQNRLLIFPGRIMHKGYSFSYQICPMRLSLAFKIQTK
tara:strand:- start:151 stop:648 length:498 start_codon:yes stop_codon:yes gene_type:complete